jgi:serine protease inhibitor ecotin
MLHYCEHKSRDKQSHICCYNCDLHICCYNCDEVDFDFRAFFAKTLLFTSIAGFCVYFLMC